MVESLSSLPFHEELRLLPCTVFEFINNGFDDAESVGLLPTLSLSCGRSELEVSVSWYRSGGTLCCPPSGHPCSRTSLPVDRACSKLSSGMASPDVGSRDRKGFCFCVTEYMNRDCA